MTAKHEPAALRPDPLAAAQEKLEAMSRRLAGDMEARKTEFERFKEDTLWRLNALSDRTIENAREEEREVEERLARDRAEAGKRLAAWREHLLERVRAGELVAALTKDAFERLLPQMREGNGNGRSD
ncbi:MAG: hypothetical protein LBC93_00105 [Synergistaceae bacterium]|jgi:hypothetical protein|nr:hypothetical protein [Synergistaceae bacterium]